MLNESVLEIESAGQLDGLVRHIRGDLVSGWVEDGRIVCPLHSLPFDPHTGENPCSSLPALLRFPCVVRDGRVHVHLGLDGKTDAKERVVVE